MWRGYKRTGIMLDMIFSGTKQKKKNRFVAHEARSKIFMDRRKIREAYIKRNKLDITINDRISSLLARF